MQNQDLKACILVKKNEAGFFSSKTPPYDIVEIIISDECVVELSFIVESNLFLKG